MDILDDVLDTLGFSGVLYFRTDFSAPWSVEVPDHEGAARFHVVVQGECHVAFPSGDSVCLRPGDMVLIPRGRSHVLSHAPDASAAPLETVLQDAGYDGRGLLIVGDGDPTAATRMICGHLTFRPGADHPLLRALPDHILATAGDRVEDPWLDDVLRLAARRIFAGGPGSEAAVRRLSEIVFIEVLRGGLARHVGLNAIAEAFLDRHIGRAIELMHARPEEDWTVEKLASEVAMSRSRFADRFGALMNMGPMSYLAEWRLQKALSMLEDSRASVQQIARQTGYRSPAAFSRAFSGKFGRPPSAYRRSSS